MLKFSIPCFTLSEEFAQRSECDLPICHEQTLAPATAERQGRNWGKRVNYENNSVVRERPKTLKRRRFSGIMKTVILDVRSPDEAMSGFAQAWKSNKQQQSARISFALPELLWKVLTAKRWELLKALCGVGPISIRETARRVQRDVKGVHGDVVVLLNVGLVSRTEDGAIEFPYEAVKVEFLLQAA